MILILEKEQTVGSRKTKKDKMNLCISITIKITGNIPGRFIVIIILNL